MQDRIRPGVPAALAALVVTAFASSAVAAQNCGTGLAGAQRIESVQYAIAYRTKPAKITIGKHFSVEFAVCPKGDRPAPESVRVDASMPQHRHGMNYTPGIKRTGPDRYRADGLMFHMPGRWELTFELRSKGQTEKLARSIVVQ